MLNSAVRIMLLACCTLTLWSAAAFADATGLYIRESQTELEAIQIIEMPDGQLSGRYESYSLDDKGKLASMSLGFNGSIVKGQLVINFRESLDTLFTTQSLSGEVKGNSLMLIWEGGTGVFDKSKSSERNKALERLNTLGSQIAWKRKAERSEKTYSDAKIVVENIRAKQTSLIAWVQEAQTTYSDFVEKRAQRERRISKMDAMNVVWDGRYQLESEIYQIESELYSLNAQVDSLRNKLDWEISSAGQDLKQIIEFCSIWGKLAQDVEFCVNVPETSQMIETLIEDLNTVFESFDSQRP